ncbi:MAG: ketosteroid isomerase-like protein [Gammaproteobacteria bacterium]|jgi:ketosteroid isomerase-like protein
MSEQDPDPSTIHDIFTERYKAGDIEGCVSLYEDNAIFISSEDGTQLHGKAGAREALQNFHALGGEFTLRTRYAVRTGDTALLSIEWRLWGNDADDKPFDLGGKSAEIARLHPDGRWRYVVDHPWGGQ